MEETTIRPGYTMPTETDGTPADYSAIEAKFGISCLTFLGTIGTTVYWSI